MGTGGIKKDKEETVVKAKTGLGMGVREGACEVCGAHGPSNARKSYAKHS